MFLSKCSILSYFLLFFLVHLILDRLHRKGFVTSTRNEKDWARGKLFTWLNEDTVFSRPTYKSFRALLDNYESSTDHAEVVTAKEEAENWEFINAIMNTNVVQEVHQVLVSRNLAPADVEQFKRKLHDIWFRLYKRNREDKSLNSSGFEHVFVGESRDGTVIGLHNWLQFYLQEKLGNIDYRGHFRRGTSDEDSPRLVTLQFLWKQQKKPIGSTFVGTSPEFEVALYTLIFLASHDQRVEINIAGHHVAICCHHLGRNLGTSYPESLA